MPSHKVLLQNTFDISKVRMINMSIQGYLFDFITLSLSLLAFPKKSSFNFFKSNCDIYEKNKLKKSLKHGEKSKIENCVKNGILHSDTKPKVKGEYGGHI